jgi:hypothetical protein
MNMLFLLPDHPHPRLETLWHTLQAAFPDPWPERLRTVEELSGRLEQLAGQTGVVLLALPDKTMLRQVRQIETRLRSFRVVIILPDRKGDTLRLAHRLRPRYVTDFECEPRDLRAVLSRMLEVYSTPDQESPPIP